MVKPGPAMEASMDWKKLTLSLVTASSLAFVGCGDDDNGGVDASDDSPTVPVQCDPPEAPETTGCEDNDAGETHYFIVHELDFGEFDATTGQTPGFNIDGCNTVAGGPTGCGHMDGRYDIDQDGTVEGLEEGIDNQIAQVAGIIGGELNIQNEINSGSILILAKVEGLNDPVNDGCVDVSLLLANVPEGETLELEGDRIVPGQTFEIDPASFNASGDPLVFGRGVLENGRLLIGPVTLALSIPVDEETDVTLTILNAQVAFNLGDGTLEVGVIGGGLNIDALVEAIAPLLGSDFSPELVLQILGPLADLDPDANNANCEAISLGLTFGAVDAVAVDADEELDAGTEEDAGTVE
jgi:hypothetical protein